MEWGELRSRHGLQTGWSFLQHRCRWSQASNSQIACGPLCQEQSPSPTEGWRRNELLPEVVSCPCWSWVGKGWRSLHKVVESNIGSSFFQRTATCLKSVVRENQGDRRDRDRRFYRVLLCISDHTDITSQPDRYPAPQLFRDGEITIKGLNRLQGEFFSRPHEQSTRHFSKRG